MKSLRQSRETWTRDLALLICRRRGWRTEDATTTDRFPTGGRFRVYKHDLFGLLDLLAVGQLDGRRTLVGIQFTSASNISTRIAKFRASDWTNELLETGMVLLVWGFRENGSLIEERVTPNEPSNPARIDQDRARRSTTSRRARIARPSKQPMAQPEGDSGGGCAGFLREKQ